MDFKSFVVILMSSVLANNYVLSRFLGICPFFIAPTTLPETVGSSFYFLSITGLKAPLKNLLPHPFLCLAQCLAQSMCSVR